LPLQFALHFFRSTNGICRGIQYVDFEKVFASDEIVEDDAERGKCSFADFLPVQADRRGIVYFSEIQQRR